MAGITSGVEGYMWSRKDKTTINTAQIGSTNEQKYLVLRCEKFPCVYQKEERGPRAKEEFEAIVESQACQTTFTLQPLDNPDKKRL